ncbi:Nek1 Ser/Thr kinase-like [Carpediemonas membranifera]|uniref:non-specific serine/threonine protein kinase n=1 Tax=Carpediemonas membranifera TaxID=201153 RepID=A0A8J6AYD4_9EUKA|nr:Nek1 Ser/Thr kinase-like [Carpediemonas membranifera]|eukprot:KAG9397108.1 Nek1 Ser/Thr kinase-like [Carpediemonas membranifera]
MHSHRRSNYQQLRKIGQGSFGSCFLVRDTKTGKQFAMKRILVANVKDAAKVKDSALQEAGLLRNLSSPFIVELHDVFYDEEQTHICMVMDYCSNGDLHDRIQRYIAERRTPSKAQVAQIITWFVQITYALYYCHDKNVLHRDLKTQNIFLRSDNIAQLGDFGIARELASSMEMAQTVVGTPYFMAPEVLRRRPYRKAADIYSLGCVLYEMLTGKYPYPARDINDLLHKMRVSKYPKDIETIKTYPFGADLYDILKKTLALDPADRLTARGLLSHPFIKHRIQAIQSEHHGWYSTYRESHPGFDEHAVMLRTAVPTPPVRSAEARLRPTSAGPAVAGRVSSAYGNGPGFQAHGIPVVAGRAMAIEGHRARPGTADRSKVPTPGSERHRNLARKQAELKKERETRPKRAESPGLVLPSADDVMEAKNATPMRQGARRGSRGRAAGRGVTAPTSVAAVVGHDGKESAQEKPPPPATAPGGRARGREQAETESKAPEKDETPHVDTPQGTGDLSTPVFTPAEDSESESESGDEPAETLTDDAPEEGQASPGDERDGGEAKDLRMAEAFIALQTVLDLPEAVSEPSFPVPGDVSVSSVLRVLDDFVAKCDVDGDDVITALFMMYQGYRALLSLGQEPSPSAIATKAGLTLLAGPDPQPRLVGNPLLAVTRYYLSKLDLVPADPPESLETEPGCFPCAVRGALACVARVAEGVVMRGGVDFIKEARQA